MNEQTIIASIRDGDVNKYEELVERYHVGLIIHCEQIVKDRNDAEDIAQEAFIKAFNQLEGYDNKKSQFSTWLYKIATNTALDFLRKQKGRIQVEDIEQVAEATMPVFLEDEERQQLIDAVAALVPPEYREVIEAYYWNGRSYQQIADELDKPVNTIRTWMRRAKVQLKEQLS